MPLVARGALSGDGAPGRSAMTWAVCRRRAARAALSSSAAATILRRRRIPLQFRAAGHCSRLQDQRGHEDVDGDTGVPLLAVRRSVSHPYPGGRAVDVSGPSGSPGLAFLVAGLGPGAQGGVHGDPGLERRGRHARQRYPKRSRSASSGRPPVSSPMRRHRVSRHRRTASAAIRSPRSRASSVSGAATSFRRRRPAGTGRSRISRRSRLSVPRTRWTLPRRGRKTVARPSFRGRSRWIRSSTSG